MPCTDPHWQPDEYAQPEADYSGESKVSKARKPSGKPSKEAKAAQMIRWRRKHRSHARDYMRRYMAARRSLLRAATALAALE